MDKAQVDALSEAQVYAQAADVAREFFGADAARRIRQLPLAQARIFLVQNGG